MPISLTSGLCVPLRSSGRDSGDPVKARPAGCPRWPDGHVGRLQQAHPLCGEGSALHSDWPQAPTGSKHSALPGPRRPRPPSCHSPAEPRLGPSHRLSWQPGVSTSFTGHRGCSDRTPGPAGAWGPGGLPAGVGANAAAVGSFSGVGGAASASLSRLLAPAVLGGALRPPRDLGAGLAWGSRPVFSKFSENLYHEWMLSFVRSLCCH